MVMFFIINPWSLVQSQSGAETEYHKTSTQSVLDNFMLTNFVMISKKQQYTCDMTIDELESQLFALEDKELDAIAYRRFDLLPTIRKQIDEVKARIADFLKTTA
jgi:hypothetical protein